MKERWKRERKKADNSCDILFCFFVGDRDTKRRSIKAQFNYINQNNNKNLKKNQFVPNKLIITNKTEKNRENKI